MHLRIRLGAEHYALALEHVLEVVELARSRRFPDRRASMLGLRNLRGEILPVLDLGTLLGIPGDGEPRRLVVVAEGGRRAGLAVDDVIDFSRLPDATTTIDSALLHGGVLVDGKLVGVVDVSAVFDTSAGVAGTGARMNLIPAQLLDVFREEATERLTEIGGLPARRGGRKATGGRGGHALPARPFPEGRREHGRIPEASAIAHAIEDVLEPARAHGALAPELVDSLLRATDELRQAVSGQPTRRARRRRPLETE